MPSNSLMKRLLCLPLFAALMPLQAEPTPEATEAKAPASKLQIAILLDTSGSMEGLIKQAQSHLWSIVNEFAKAKKEGQETEFEVALYEYGNDGLSKKSNYIRKIIDLTTDLDKVSEELFALKTNGGEEYCGAVIEDAVGKLKWSESNKDFKAIYIAGNEPFTQGPVPYAKACQAAIEKGIVVNTIHCGPEAQATEGKWKDGAKLADGAFVTIDHNAVVEQIDTPQDQKLADLNVQLNSTYLSYGGAQGEASKARQMTQDANAVGAAPGAAMKRIASKSSVAYKNSSWDLVDAKKEGKLDLDKAKDEELPAELKGKSVEEKTKFVQELAEKRAEIQKEIGKLAQEREQFLLEERKRRAKENDKTTLESAVTSTVEEQISNKGFSLEKK